MDLELETEENYYFKVKLGKLTYEIELSSLIAVMANQIISSNPALSHEENYDIAFEVTKNEIFDYLKSLDTEEKDIRLIDILSIKAGSDEDSFEIDIDDPLINDDDSLLKWIQENLTWNDISHFAEEIQRPQPEPDYNDEWKESTKIIKEWENTFSILELVGKTDIIDESQNSDEPDD